MAQATSVTTPRLTRLLDFAEPGPDDFCLDLSYGPASLATALAPRVRHLTSIETAPIPDDTAPDLASAARATRRPEAVSEGTGEGRMPTLVFGKGPRTLVRGAARLRADARALPCRDAAFSLVTCRSALYRMDDAEAALREMLRVCRPGGRLVIADLIRPNARGLDRDRIERLRDPGHPPTPSIARLVELVTQAGADVRRLDVFTVERPVETWLGPAADGLAARRIRAMLTEEVDGGPRTGAKPRIIGGELWITQRWIHLAASPIGPGTDRFQH